MGGTPSREVNQTTVRTAVGPNGTPNGTTFFQTNKQPSFTPDVRVEGFPHKISTDSRRCARRSPPGQTPFLGSTHKPCRNDTVAPTATLGLRIPPPLPRARGLHAEGFVYTSIRSAHQGAMASGTPLESMSSHPKGHSVAHRGLSGMREVW